MDYDDFDPYMDDMYAPEDYDDSDVLDPEPPSADDPWWSGSRSDW